jgi:hypothetical protein
MVVIYIDGISETNFYTDDNKCSLLQHQLWSFRELYPIMIIFPHKLLYFANNFDKYVITKS